MTPEMVLNKVVLPAPLGPTTATNWPSSTSSDTSFKALSPPYATLSDRIFSTFHPLPAEIGFNHRRILHHLGGSAAGDQLAMVEYAEFVDQFHHRLHRVLNNGDGNAIAVDAAENRQKIVERVVSEASERFVEQQQLWARRQRARELHQAQLLGRQAACDGVGLLVRKANPIECLHRQPFGLRIAVRADEGADHDILQHRHARESTNDLKRSPDAEPADFVRS